MTAISTVPEILKFEFARLWAGLCSSGDGQLKASIPLWLPSSVAVQALQDSGLYMRTMGETENRGLLGVVLLWLGRELAAGCWSRASFYKTNNSLNHYFSNTLLC